MEPKDMGNKIKNARMAKGMTQKELASQVHVTDKAVSKWERGLCFPDMSNLEPLADALGFLAALWMARSYFRRAQHAAAL